MTRQDKLLRSLRIVGFSGKRGAGKSKAALYLARKYGYHTISFGNGLREMAKDFFPFTPTDFSETNKEKPYKEYDWTPRDFMIALGKFARFHDQDFWVKKSCLDKTTGLIAIDDVRFPNEVEYIKSLGGKIVRLERYEKLNIYGKNLDDPSETSLDDYKGFDHVVESCVNITLDDLYYRLDIMVKDLSEDENE